MSNTAISIAEDRYAGDDDLCVTGPAEKVDGGYQVVATIFVPDHQVELAEEDNLGDDQYQNRKESEDESF